MTQISTYRCLLSKYLPFLSPKQRRWQKRSFTRLSFLSCCKFDQNSFFLMKNSKKIQKNCRKKKFQDSKTVIRHATLAVCATICENSIPAGKMMQIMSKELSSKWNSFVQSGIIPAVISNTSNNSSNSYSSSSNSTGSSSMRQLEEFMNFIMYLFLTQQKKNSICIADFDMNGLILTLADISTTSSYTSTENMNQFSENSNSNAAVKNMFSKLKNTAIQTLIVVNSFVSIQHNVNFLQLKKKNFKIYEFVIENTGKNLPTVSKTGKGVLEKQSLQISQNSDGSMLLTNLFTIQKLHSPSSATSPKRIPNNPIGLTNFTNFANAINNTLAINFKGNLAETQDLSHYINGRTTPTENDPIPNNNESELEKSMRIRSAPRRMQFFKEKKDFGKNFKLTEFPPDTDMDENEEKEKAFEEYKEPAGKSTSRSIQIEKNPEQRSKLLNLLNQKVQKQPELFQFNQKPIEPSPSSSNARYQHHRQPSNSATANFAEKGMGSKIETSTAATSNLLIEGFQKKIFDEEPSLRKKSSALAKFEEEFSGKLIKKRTETGSFSFLFFL